MNHIKHSASGKLWSQCSVIVFNSYLEPYVMRNTKYERPNNNDIIMFTFIKEIVCWTVIGSFPPRKFLFSFCHTAVDYVLSWKLLSPIMNQSITISLVNLVFLYEFYFLFGKLPNIHEIRKTPTYLRCNGNITTNSPKKLTSN